MPDIESILNIIFKESKKYDQSDQHSLAISQYSLVISN